MKSHDPRTRARRSRGSTAFESKHRRKLNQLCRQAYRALSYTIPGDLADPLLQELSVDQVLPAPDASRLLVRLICPRKGADTARLLERLGHVEGYLRAQIAATIMRKRAPELTFQLVFSGEVEQ
jgi:ribosome-binding factor A